MTKLIFALCLLGSTSAMAAFPSAAEMKENFETCSTEANYWHQRFGQYVVAFDIYTAAEACRNEPGSYSYSSPRVATCKVDGARLKAGFYCEGHGE